MNLEPFDGNREDWMEPLLEFRNYLASLQDSSVWPDIRKYKRRNGHIKFKDGVPQPWGPYTLDTRKDLLRRLLVVQKKIGSLGTNEGGQLINKSELEAIRTLWRVEEQDWADSVPQIYQDVLGEESDWIRYETPVFSREEQTALEITCSRYGVAADLVAKLLELERSMHGMSRRASIQQRISTILEEDWRTVDDLDQFSRDRRD
jgi:DNA sulfur modification protein DndC